MGAGRLNRVACCGAASMRWFAILLLPLKGFGLLGRVIGDLLAATLYQRVKIWALGGITFKISETLSKFLRFSTPLYITLWGTFYILTLRFLKVIDEQDLTLINQVFGAKIGWIISKALYHHTPSKKS